MSERARPEQSVTIGRFTARDIEAGLGLTGALGWPHRREDWEFAAELGDGLCAREAAGAFLGCGFRWAYGPAAATLGLILVAPEARGRGLGRTLTQALISGAGGRALMLNATEAGLPVYRKLGFVPTGEIRQHQGTFAGAGAPGIGRPARPDDLAALIALDAAGFGAERPTLIARLVEAGETRIIEEKGEPVAFAIRRSSGRGEVIGPILAREEDEAIALVDALAVPGFLRADIPADAPRLAAALESRGLARVDQATVMTRGTWPAPSGSGRRFGLVSQALG